MKLTKLNLTKKNKFLNNYIASYENENGHKKDYEIISRNPNLTKEAFGEISRKNSDAVGIIMLNEKRDKILLQKEFRMACNEWVYNFPGGLRDGDESILEAAKRELREETGLEIIEYIGMLPAAYTAVGFCNESVATVIGIAKGEFSPSTSQDEEIEAKWYTKDKVFDLVNSGAAMSLRTQSFLYMWSTGLFC